MRVRSSLLPVIVALSLLAAACSSDDGASPSPGPSTTDGQRADVDPERYVEDYVEGDLELSAPTAEVAVDAAVGMPVPPPAPDPGFHDDNTFVAPGEHGFVDPAERPQSTFGLDVDTGSLSIGRTFLRDGRTRPPADSVRVEEWVNAIGSDQPAPTDADLGLELAGTRSPVDDVDVLRVGIAGREVPAEQRPPANLTFVVDTSGSMDIRERLGLVQASLALLVRNLRDGDTISVVTFDQDAQVLLEPTPVEQAEAIIDAIDALGPGGGTNLEAGLRRGYEQAAASFRPEGTNAVILASDGVANIGRTGPDELVAEIRDQADDGIHLVTLGYGMGGYDDHRMEQLANQGDGFYAYLDTYEEAEQLFGDRLTSLLTVVAHDAKVQVDFDPAVVESYRLLGYENRALDVEDFDDDTVDAGEVGAGHRVVALYELRLRDGAAPEAPAGQVSLRYRSAGTGEQVTASEPISAELFETDLDAADPALQLQVATAAFADLLRGSAIAGDRAYTIDDTRELAAAAADLAGDRFAGAAVTPAEVVELMRLAGDL